MLPRLPPITQALLIANIVVFLLQWVFGKSVEWLFALWPYAPAEGSPFMPWQLLTCGFLHGDLLHLFFNMLALVMFGAQLEHIWGGRRYLTYFLVCVAGAGLCQLILGSVSVAQGGEPYPTVGASGGVFGLLLGCGMLFPNRRMMLFFPPIPMKARTLVIVFGVVQLLLAFTGLESGVAHFAHLGGMVFGWLLILYWRRAPRPPSSNDRKPKPRHLKVVK